MSRAARQWKVRPSGLARNTHNSIREIIEDLNLKPNPNKIFIPLSVGDPTSFGNLKPPEQLLDAVRESVGMKESRSYSPCIGNYQAREAILKYSKIQGDVTPDDVIISNGCAHAIELVVSTLAEAGQNIIVPRPGYGIHKTLGEGLGIEIKYYDLLPNDKWKVDLKSLEKQIDENTVAIVVNNPSNTCGSVYSKQHLREILDVASRNHLPIIADEIYEHFVFSNEEFVPIASLSKDVPVFTCSGLSKRFLVPGWRVGWVIVHDRSGHLEKDVLKGMYNMTSRILGANTLMQLALPKILACAAHSYFNDMMLFIENQAKTACEELQKAPGLRPIMPQGSMYMMVEIKLSLFSYTNELQFIKDLCEEQSVLCIPGKCFNYPGFMRIVLTVPKEVLLEACSRIIVFTNKHANALDEANGIPVGLKFNQAVRQEYRTGIDEARTQHLALHPTEDMLRYGKLQDPIKCQYMKDVPATCVLTPIWKRLGDGHDLYS